MGAIHARVPIWLGAPRVAWPMDATFILEPKFLFMGWLGSVSASVELVL